MRKTYLVTGGSGFLGSALVKRLVEAGHAVRVFDNESRGNQGRLSVVREAIEFIRGDIRDAAAVERATRGVDSVCHLAFVNGTEYFYSHPELVLDVGVKGITNVIDACLKRSIGELILASSSEVYHQPPIVPTDESVPLSIPDPLNPRYSYAAGKLISEIIALNYGRNRIKRVVVFRPHNVFGPDMGWEHVIPQFVIRMKNEIQRDASDPVQFRIQGTGRQTRAFVFIDDFIDALMLVLEKGDHLGIYHIGTMEEISIATLAGMVGEYFGRRVSVIPTAPALGGAERRCPDIRKVAALGYQPRWTMAEALEVTARWYDKNSAICPNPNLNFEGALCGQKSV
jgi:nucleoside-diphosphate-sugar epimerase